MFVEIDEIIDAGYSSGKSEDNEGEHDKER